MLVMSLRGRQGKGDRGFLRRYSELSILNTQPIYLHNPRNWLVKALDDVFEISSTYHTDKQMS